MPQLNIPISLKKKEAGDPQSPRTPQSDEGRLQRSNSSVVGRTKQSPSRSNSFRDRLRLNRASEPDLTAAADAGEPDPSSPLSQRSSSFRDRFRRRSRKGDSESDLKAAADAGEPDASSPISDDQSENGAESPQRSWHDRLRSKGSSPRIRSQSSGSLRQKVVSMLGCEHDIDRERTNAPFNNRFGRLCVTWHSTELPPGAASLKVLWHSPYFGSADVLGSRAAATFEAQVDLCDRLGDVTLQLLDAEDKVVAQTGFPLPSVNYKSEELQLRLVPVDGPHPLVQGLEDPLGVAPVSFSVTYDWKAELRMMKCVAVAPAHYLDPPVPIIRSGSESKSILALLLYWVDPDAVINAWTAALDVLFFTDRKRSLMCLGATCGGVVVLGYLDVWLPAVFAGLLGLLYRGRAYRAAYAEHGRRRHPKGVVGFFTQNLNLARWGLAQLWALLWAGDAALQLITWQIHIRTLYVFLLLCVATALSLWVPVYLLLVPVVAFVFVVPGLMWRYPVMMSYACPPHIKGLRLRNRPPKPFLGLLTLTVSRAHSLRPADLTTQIHPYALVSVGTQVKRTACGRHTEGKDAEWDEELQFVVFDPAAPVQIWLFDRDRVGADDFLGECCFQTTGARDEDEELWLNVGQRATTPGDFHYLIGGRLLVEWRLRELACAPGRKPGPAPGLGVMTPYKPKHDHAKGYLELEGFATLTLRGREAPPPECPEVWVTCRSVWAKKVQRMADASDKGWAVTLTLADRVSDVVIEYCDQQGHVVLMAGLGPNALGDAEGTLTLSTVWATPRFDCAPPKAEKGRPLDLRLGPEVTVAYSVAYDRAAEARLLWSHPNTAASLAVPQMSLEQLYLTANHLAARLLYIVPAPPRLAALVFGGLFWESHLLNGVVLPGLVSGICELGLSRYCALQVLAVLTAALFYQRRQRAWYAANARREGPAPKAYIVKHPAVRRLGVSALWAAAWAADAAARLFTWQNAALTQALAAALAAGAVASLFLPAWLFLAGGLLLAFVVVGPLLKYPVLHTYLWPSHVQALARRRGLRVRPYVARLTVTVHAAHSLVNSDITSDLVYVAAFVGGQTQRTPTVTARGDAHAWDKELEFVVFGPQCHVTLWVADYDMGNHDDFLGEAILETHGAAAQGERQWLNLQQRGCRPEDYSRLVRGRLDVSWRLEPVA